MKLFVHGGPRLLFGFRLGIIFDPRELWNVVARTRAGLAGTFIYVIQDAQGRSKVGVSQDPRQRLRELQTGHPERLELVWCAVTPGTGFAIENTAKQMGEAMRMSGEWFQLHPLTLASMVQSAAVIEGQALQAIPVAMVATILENTEREAPEELAFPLNSPWLFTAGLSAILAITFNIWLILNFNH